MQNNFFMSPMEIVVVFIAALFILPLMFIAAIVFGGSAILFGMYAGFRSLFVKKGK